MGVFRVNKNKNYTVMSNVHLRDKALPLKAKGLLSLMLSLPEDWDYSMRGLAKLSADGLDSTRAAVKALERSGYVVRRQLYDSRGRFSNNEYTVFEIPQPSSPSSDLPLTGKPSTEKSPSDAPLSEKPSQINTDQVITQKRNTDLNNYQSINLDGMDRMDERSEYEEIIKENLDYDILCQDPKFDKDRFREIMDIMLDAVCSTAPTIRINGEDMPQQVVKSRFLKLNSSHIEYVLEAMNKNMVPFDSRSAFQTSGIRVGTPAITTRGAKEPLMAEIVEMIDTVLAAPECDKTITAVREKVNGIMKEYPIFAW